MKPHHLLTLLIGCAWLAPTTAHAQDYSDLDDVDNAKKKKKDKAKRDVRRPEVREIVKGTYAKSNVGAAVYLGNFAGFVSPGTSLGLTVGQDFIDHETMSMAWEFMFFQGIHNACHFESQAQGLCPGAPGQPGPLVQGDMRTYTIAAALEWSTYPTRRVGIGARVGGGVLMSPLLMDEAEYQTEVVMKSWGGVEPGYHGPPHPIVQGGPTFEYYTKLSHFSLGLDADVFYAIGFDLGANITGYMKYTF